MINISKDILSLSDFKRRSAELVQKVKRTNRPLILTVNGKAELVVQDAVSYQKMVETLERAEAIEGIARGMKDVEEGRSISLQDLDRKMRKKYRIPRSPK